ncbi:hypothetical protein BV898_13373 [Hypsibius exemplaris]|uniref:Uncharacterized protein n=1 Tax=Hypsibius exemplaris TaxID=2072580 RepID=A0A1W0WAV0_HYPEX|nr:hypothetical protein BV898_13373 [Hypsibius exemplaris]
MESSVIFLLMGFVVGTFATEYDPVPNADQDVIQLLKDTFSILESQISKDVFPRTLRETKAAVQEFQDLIEQQANSRFDEFNAQLLRYQEITAKVQSSLGEAVSNLENNSPYSKINLELVVGDTLREISNTLSVLLNEAEVTQKAALDTAETFQWTLVAASALTEEKTNVKARGLLGLPDSVIFDGPGFVADAVASAIKIIEVPVSAAFAAMEKALRNQAESARDKALSEAGQTLLIFTKMFEPYKGPLHETYDEILDSLKNVFEPVGVFVRDGQLRMSVPMKL